MDVSDASQVVAACCVLHNICEVHNESFNDEEWIEKILGTADLVQALLHLQKAL